MVDFRRIAAPILTRGVLPMMLVAALLAFLRQERAAAALAAGAIVGFVYQLHIARGFDRLASRQKLQLPLVVFESVLRVCAVAIVPVLIVGRGPLVGYLTYFVGFVAPFAVAIFTIRNLMNVNNGASPR
jgi:hypothetical protein